MKDSESNSFRGNAFRDEVLSLINLQPAYSNIRSEVQIASQDVDIYYEEQTSVGQIRVACECKDYERSLTRSDLESIYSKYNPLRPEHVDAVLIVASRELGANAQSYLKTIRFHFTTLERLEAKIIDFRLYMRSLMSLYEEDGLNEFYITPTRLPDGSDLTADLLRWVTSVDTPDQSTGPIAILGGYGMGKTSLARYIAYYFAQKALSGARTRIPIYVPLAEIAGEQSLEGLLGRQLAANNRVPRYHFGMFRELNRRGRLLIILDGFDEMKHTMSRAEFRYSFSQLNRLVEPQARVLLLGRPSVFLSKAEEAFALKGKRLSGQQEYVIPSAPEYTCIRLPPFSLEQALTFVRRYSAYLMKRMTEFGRDCVDIDLIRQRLEAIPADAELSALIVRPIQAKMLVDLAFSPKVLWQSFTRYKSRYKLYEEFMSRLLDSEVLKLTRKAFGAEQRLTFVQSVAWWVWNLRADIAFTIDEIPEALIEAFRNDNDVDLEAVKRDLVAGSILERKLGDRCYFPHRSYVEFLVARHLLTEVWTEETLECLSSRLNSEIRAFISDSAKPEAIARWVPLWCETQVVISPQAAGLLGWAINETANGSGNVKPTRPQEVLATYFYLMDIRAHGLVIEFTTRVFRQASDDKVRLSCLWCLLHTHQRLEESMRDTLRQHIVAVLLSESIGFMEALCCEEVSASMGDGSDGPPMIGDDRPLPFRILAAVTSMSRVSPRRLPHIELDLPVFREILCGLLQPLPVNTKVEIPPAGTTWSIPVHALAEFEPRIAADMNRGNVRRFFELIPEPVRRLPADSVLRRLVGKNALKPPITGFRPS